MSGIEDNSGWSESPDAEYDLMTVAQHNRIVEQFKRDAERLKSLLAKALPAVLAAEEGLSPDQIEFVMAGVMSELSTQPDHGAKLEMVKTEQVCKFCAGTGKQSHVYEGSVPCESCKQDEVKL